MAPGSNPVRVTKVDFTNEGANSPLLGWLAPGAMSLSGGLQTLAESSRGRLREDFVRVTPLESIHPDHRYCGQDNCGTHGEVRTQRLPTVAVVTKAFVLPSLRVEGTVAHPALGRKTRRSAGGRTWWESSPSALYTPVIPWG